MSELAYGSITISDLTDGVSYYVESSVQAILQNAPTQSELVDSNGNNIIDSNGNLIIVQGSSFLPSSITFYAKTRTGKNSPTAYDGRFLIEESEDGVEWIAQYTSSKDESEHDYVPISDDMRYIRCTLYESGGGASLYSQTIMVINEPKTLKRIDNYYRITDSATAPTSGWSKNPTAIPTPTELLPYLWTYQEQYYSDGSVVTVRPTIIAKYGCNIRSIETWYIQKTDGVTPELADPDWRTYLVAYVNGKSYWSKLRYYYDNNSGEQGLYFESDPVLEDSREYAIEQNEAARDMADDYNEIILATNQHFWWDTNGAHVSVQSQKDYDVSPSGANMLQNANGIQLRDGTTTLSQYSPSGIQIGQTAQNHSIYSANGAFWYKPEEQTAFMKIENGVMSDAHSLWSEVPIAEYDNEETPPNPSELGWYEFDDSVDVLDNNDGLYVLTTDTSIRSNKTYYTKSYWNYWDMPEGRVRWGDANQYLIFNDKGLTIKADSIMFGPSEDTLSNTIFGINTMIEDTQNSFNLAVDNINKRIDSVNGLSGIDVRVIHTDVDSLDFDKDTFIAKNTKTNEDGETYMDFMSYTFEYGDSWMLLTDDDGVYSANLLLADHIHLYGSQTSGETLDVSGYMDNGSVTYTRSANKNKGFYITRHAITQPSTEYTVHFGLQQDESSASNITSFYLYSLTPNNVETSELFIDGVSYGSAINNEYEIDLTDHEVHDVIINFTSTATIQSGTYLGLILQLNKNSATAFTANLSDLSWMKGNEIGAWVAPPFLFEDDVDLSEYGIAFSETPLSGDQIIINVSGTYESLVDINTLVKDLDELSQNTADMGASFNETLEMTKEEISENVNGTIDNAMRKVNETTENQIRIVENRIANNYGSLLSLAEMFKVDGSSDWFKALYTGIGFDQKGIHVYGVDTVFDDDGYHLARTDVEVGIAPDRISFKKGGQSIAWIGDINNGSDNTYKLRIQEADIIKNVRIGDLGFVPRSNGNMCLKFVGGDDMLGWYINYESFTATSNGKCYFYGYDVEGDAQDISGYVYVNSRRINIPKGCWVNGTSKTIPCDVKIYIVYNLNDAKFYNVWAEGDVWYCVQYTSSGVIGEVTAYTWDETDEYNDVILGHYQFSNANNVVYDILTMPDDTHIVMPDEARIGMGKIVSDGEYFVDMNFSQLYKPIKTYSEITG